MSQSRKPFLCGNWKMNKDANEARSFFSEFFESEGYAKTSYDVGVSPAFLSLNASVESCEHKKVMIFSQNVHFEESGAFTGEVSTSMLKSAGVSGAIIGHSERRQYFAETDETVAKKVSAVLLKGMMAIACVGEVQSERESGKTIEVVGRQIRAILDAVDSVDNLVIAYEPVWAIGTGLTATPDQAQEVHAAIRDLIKEKFGAAESQKVRILYGGSMKPANAAELLAKPDIDGGLIGGASLQPASFAEMLG